MWHVHIPLLPLFFSIYVCVCVSYFVDRTIPVLLQDPPEVLSAETKVTCL